MENWQIVLIVFGSIFCVYLLLLLMALIFILVFKTILKKHERGFAVILATKLLNLKTIYQLMEDNGIEVDNKSLALLNDIAVEDFAHQDTKECEKARSILSYLRDEVMITLNSHPELNSINDLAVAKRNIIEQDKIYHQFMAMYNADVLGYNYWIRFLPWRWLFKLVKTKRKDII